MSQPGSEPHEGTNHRLAFYQQLHVIESLELPYAFHPDQDAGKLLLARKAARDALSGWRIDLAELYPNADKEYVRIKTEKPRGPYLRHALALNVRPLVHNLMAFHLTAQELYARQARQNLSGIMHQLAEKGCPTLRRFLSLLLDDMNNGAAVLE